LSAIQAFISWLRLMEIAYYNLRGSRLLSFRTSWDRTFYNSGRAVHQPYLPQYRHHAINPIIIHGHIGNERVIASLNSNTSRNSKGLFIIHILKAYLGSCIQIQATPLVNAMVLTCFETRSDEGSVNIEIRGCCRYAGKCI